MQSQQAFQVLARFRSPLRIMATALLSLSALARRAMQLRLRSLLRMLATALLSLSAMARRAFQLSVQLRSMLRIMKCRRRHHPFGAS